MREDEELPCPRVVLRSGHLLVRLGSTIVSATLHLTTSFIADPIHVEHALLSPLGVAAVAESLQMAFAASELAIADVRAFSRAAPWRDTLVMQKSGR